MRISFIVFLSLISSFTYCQSNKFKSVLWSYNEYYLQLNPSIATALGDNRYNDKLENEYSETYRKASIAFLKRYQDSLKLIRKNTLSQRDQLSYDIFSFELKRALKRFTFPTYLDPITQFRDYRLNFSQLGGGTGNHPFKTVKDYEDFLERINAFVEITDTAISNMRLGIKAGRVQPRVIMEKVLPQLRAMLPDSIQQSIFYNPVKNMPAAFSSEDKTRITNSYTVAIRDKVMPAYRKLLQFIEREYMQHTRSQVGLSATPNGKKEYEYWVSYYTTMNISPDQVFKTGLSEVKRIRAEMENIRKQVEYKGDLKSFFDQLFADKKFFPFKTEEEVVNGYLQIYEKMKPQLNAMFNMVPKTAFEIRPIEKYRAATAAAHYFQGTTDGTRPGIFYFPVLDATKYHYWRMENLFLHEAIPGHHFQISLQLENNKIPDFQKSGRYGAYVEGWGLYAERLGDQLGLYKDPYQLMGQLYGEIHRAIRLVVDVGMHYKGWTSEQAIQYSLDNEPTSRETATREIERYIAMPGQALSYKIGELKILEMRKKAEKVLGKSFNLRNFHDEVLKDGAMPLMIFESKMNRWISVSKTNP